MGDHDGVPPRKRTRLSELCDSRLGARTMVADGSDVAGRTDDQPRPDGDPQPQFQAKHEVAKAERNLETLRSIRAEERSNGLSRLILQTLDDLGFRKSADTLQKESGLSLESATVIDFRKAVLSGDWSTVESIESSLELRRDVERNDVRFLIRQQKYLELLEEGDTRTGLRVLRNEITPLGVNNERLRELSSYIMCADANVLREVAAWDGARGSSRSVLLSEIQQCVLPQVMFPPRRLECLIAQAQAFQRDMCLYHNSVDGDASLLEDHFCDRSLFPCETSVTLEGHSDEVWYVVFSHTGRYLASASKDKSAIVWSLETFRPKLILNGHADSVSFVAWSPDDTVLLTCGNDHAIIAWDAVRGVACRRLLRHTEPVTACAWLPNGREFVSGGMDNRLLLWNVGGEIVFSWRIGRVADLAVSADGSRLVSVSNDKKIRVYDLISGVELFSIREQDNMTSVTISEDNRFALVNVASQEVHLWDLHDRQLVMKYVGLQQGRFVIRSTFGGVNQGIVVSGSEDHFVYCWRRERGVLLEVLAGHTGTVNSVSWNPVDPYVFASASDDRTIRIWKAPYRTARETSRGSVD